MASANRIAMLEEQLVRMQEALDEERFARQEANHQISTLVAELRHRSPLHAQRRLTPQKQQQRSVIGDRLPPSPGRDSPTAISRRYVTPPRAQQQHSAVSSARRTSDSKFVTPRSSNSTERRRVGQTPLSRQTPPRGVASRPSSAATEKSVLELAWDKFAGKVQALSPDELALVTVETLTKLLDSFGVVDELERAQIEAQWSILQRECEASFGIHSQEFNLRPDPKKPTLSKRTPLERRSTPTRSSNPNQAGDPNDRPSPCGIQTRPTASAPSNPNDLATPDHGSHRKPSFKATPMTPRGPDRPIGIMAVPSPSSADVKLRGIRSTGSTHQCTKDPSPTGLRAPLARSDEYGSFAESPSCTDGAMRRRTSNGGGGIRTFVPQHSPSPRDEAFGPMCPKSPRGSFYAVRDSIVTESVVNSPTSSHRPSSASLTRRQSRTPYAVDA